MSETKWVIMNMDQNCIVKGRSRKYLVGIDEPTRKETVYYQTATTAKNALRRSYILCSDYVQDRYGEVRRVDLMPVELTLDDNGIDMGPVDGMTSSIVQ